MLKENITMREMNIADLMLKRFVIEYETFYSKSSMTMNVHCLLHLTECVKNLGPLWAYSMFSFEPYNGSLKKYGQAPNNVVHQVVESIVKKSSTKTAKLDSTNSIETGSNKISVDPSEYDLIAMRDANIIGEIIFLHR